MSDTVREAPFCTLSRKIHTDWAFTSSHTDGTGGSLATGWTCPPDFAATACGVVPLMTARYDLPTCASDRAGDQEPTHVSLH